MHSTVLHFHTIFQSSRENSAHEFELLLVNQFEGWRKGIAWKGWQKLQIIKYVEFAFNIWVQASLLHKDLKKVDLLLLLLSYIEKHSSVIYFQSIGFCGSEVNPDEIFFTVLSDMNNIYLYLITLSK